MLQSKEEDLGNEMSDDEEKSASEGEEPVQTLAASRSRRDNAGKRFVPLQLNLTMIRLSLGSRASISLKRSKS